MVLMSDASGAISFTTFCRRNETRVSLAGTLPPPLLFACEPCPPGKRSLGGIGPCIECGGVQCTDPTGELTYRVEHDDLADRLAHLDTFTMVVAAYNAPEGVNTALKVSASGRVLVDLSPPLTGSIIPCYPKLNRTAEGNFSACESTRELIYSLPTDVIAARWHGFEDWESGLIGYDVCVGSAPLLCDVVPAERVSNGTNSINVTLPNGPAEHGSSLCFSVEALNGVGGRSDRISSTCILIDNTPPVLLKGPNIGSDADIHMDEQGTADIIISSGVAADDITPVEHVEFCIGSSNITVPNGTNFSEWHPDACDISPLKRAPADIDNYTAAMESASVAINLRVDTAGVPSGKTIFIGMRPRNAIDLWGEWKWSPPTRIGATAATIASESQKSKVVCELEGEATPQLEREQAGLVNATAFLSSSPSSFRFLVLSSLAHDGTSCPYAC